MAAAATGAGLLRMRGPAHSGRVVETCVRSRSSAHARPCALRRDGGDQRGLHAGCQLVVRPASGGIDGGLEEWSGAARTGGDSWSSQDWRSLLEQPGLEGTGWAGQGAGWQIPGLWADSQALLTDAGY